jgi:Clp amino terminal domain, pathogenicity island component
MFERYTEKARRVIYFGRYEASQFGSPEINTAHLLLGLLREDCGLMYQSVPNLQPESVRKKIEAWSQRGEPIPTNRDLPLSSDARAVLKYAADESERLAHKYIGTEHLLLGLLDEEKCFAAQLLRESGADVTQLRERFAEAPAEASETRSSLSLRVAEGSVKEEMVSSHRSRFKAAHVRHFVKYCHMYNWHWAKRTWKPQDAVVNRKTGRVSLDIGLVSESSDFELLKAGWKKGHCLICRWELFESTDNEHGIGSTNGREWLCTECYEKFVQQPGFSPTIEVDLRS